MPPDVRRGSASPSEFYRPGLRPWFGLRPNDFGRSPHWGRSPVSTPSQTARQSPASHRAAEPHRIEFEGSVHHRTQLMCSPVHICSHGRNLDLRFSAYFSTIENGMAVVVATATRQRVRVALFICPRPLECRSRLFSRLPFGTPLRYFAISVDMMCR